MFSSSFRKRPNVKLSPKPGAKSIKNATMKVTKNVTKSPNKIASTKQEMNARMKDKPNAKMFLSKNAKTFISLFPNKSKKQFAMAMMTKIHILLQILLTMKFSMSKMVNTKQTVQIKSPKS